MHNNQKDRNIWMVKSVYTRGLKKRWHNLFIISAVTAIAFLCVSVAAFQTVFGAGNSNI